MVLAGIGHAGGQGSSAYSQRELWAPSRVPEVASREVPKWMEEGDIAAVIDGFRTAARLAASAGLDGVEVNAGQHSLIRQFLSGLTNHRSDDWGTDRLRFARTSLAAARQGIGAGRVLGLQAVLRRAGPMGRHRARGRRGHRRRAGADGRLRDGREGLDLQHRRHPPGRSCRAVVQRRTVPDHSRGGRRPGAGGAPGLRGRRGRRRGRGRGRRGRSGRDDQSPDRRSRSRRQAGRRPVGADPPVHPVQPGLPGTRRPQSDRDVRRPSHLGTRDRRSAARRNDGAAGPGGRRRWWTRGAGVRPGRRRRGATTCGWSSGRPGSAGWSAPPRPARAAAGWPRWSTGRRPSAAGSASRSSAAPR